MHTTSSEHEKSEKNSTWLVIAQIGPMKEREGDDEFVDVDTIVMAQRGSEEEAERECRRRNGLNDGRTYFVMSEEEYNACDVVEKNTRDHTSPIAGAVIRPIPRDTTGLPFDPMDETVLRDEAARVMQAPTLTGKSYAEIVHTLTAANYVADCCIRELEQRGKIEFFDGMPVIPDARPESMLIEHVLTRPDA